MSKKSIKENEFYGAPGGSAGTVNYGTGYGTPASPDISQEPGHFESSNRNKALGSNSNTAKDSPKRNAIANDVNAIYAKKDVPTPDEVVTGIKFEMGQQIKKDKFTAKQAVLDNLKKDPHYYGKLKMLNIDDKSMVDNMTENKQHPNDAPARLKVTPNVEATKQIFAEMSQGKDQKYVVNSQICDVMKEMWEAKRQRSAWKRDGVGKQP